MRMYYEETYGSFYDTDEKYPSAAEKKLLKDIGEGKENAPEECQNSLVVSIVGNGNPQFQIMGARIDAMSDQEKEFYLWHLLRYYYKPTLIKNKEEYSNDATTVNQITRLLDNVEEIDTLLTYDLF